ncbi:MAG: hypothetical protein JRJ12_01390 [Deltaproteobacteria bacterium]|nr:hypothetical protein [Deltaproteobacteria bacterium]MBW2070178.1 hypothetical protein [Deltaproteobacteria bacterium]
MDTEKFLQKVAEWLSDPKRRELLGNIFYLALPLLFILFIRKRKRPAAGKPEAAVLKPKIRPLGESASFTPETLKETMARERKKIDRELQELFGRKERLLKKARDDQAVRSRSTQRVPPKQPPRAQGQELFGEELLRFLGRRK